eukprot:scaffold5828_cov168-Amphora_coffeaeformis.AAC.25
MIFANTRYLLVALLVATAEAFAPAATVSRRSQTALSVGYVPDGLSPAEYEKIKKQDRAKAGKDLGRLGPRGFVSRSMQGWQEAYERGETSHTFAPINYRQQLKEKKIKATDVPYMVRGGKWDNSDCNGAKKQKWLKSDKDYAKGGYKKEQSVSILGSGPGLNWSGERREDDGARRAYPGFF